MCLWARKRRGAGHTARDHMTQPSTQDRVRERTSRPCRRGQNTAQEKGPKARGKAKKKGAAVDKNLTRAVKKGAINASGNG